jgi:asparagine synthase (glutamine-hydrolysing)
MPGIVGFVKEASDDHSKQLLAGMARRMENEYRFQVDMYSADGIGLGRVSLGITNPEPQPVWNDDGSVGLVMEGELYDRLQAERILEERGRQVPHDNDALLVLRMYEVCGEELVSHLNGAFAIAIWDRRATKLILANDRLDLHPLYYAQLRNGLMFGSGVRALLANADLPRTVDKLAIAQFLTFDHVLGNRSLLTEVKRLPPASVLTYQNGALSIRSYWLPLHPGGYELRSEQEWIDGLLFHLRQAVKRQSRGALPAGLLLSGGLDSRALLATLAEDKAPGAFTTFTWGIPGCDDARFAREASKQAGVRNLFFELEPDWLLKQADDGVRTTDGMGNVVNLHAMATLEAEARYAKVIYKGFQGDAMMGYGMWHGHWAHYDPALRRQAHFQAYLEQGLISFNQRQQERLFTPAFRREGGDQVLESFGAALQECPAQDMGDQRIWLDLRHRVPRMTLNGVDVVRSRAVVRLPFCDQELVAFSLRIPPGLRYQRRLMKNAFVQAFPHLAKVPVTETGLPMIDCARDVVLRGESWLRWQARKAGLKRVAVARRRPYRDYKNWFRTLLRPWVEETLLGARALERGYFEPEAVRRLVAEHMAGSDHTVRLGALLAIELWHRQAVD